MSRTLCATFLLIKTMKKLITLLCLYCFSFSYCQNLDKNIGDSIFFDLKNASYTNVQDSFFIDVPVSIKTLNNISNFDFWFKFNQAKLTYISTHSILSGLDAFTNYNSTNQTLSNTSSGPTLSYVVPNNVTLMKLRFLMSSKCLTILNSDFTNINVLTEGSTAKYQIINFTQPNIQGGDQVNCSEV